jgi:hypothetical protein
MGLDEVQVEIGDKIFVVSGSSVPLVLRPLSSTSEKGLGNSTRYKLVFGAYIHKIIDGQMLKNNAGLWMEEKNHEIIELM